MAAVVSTNCNFTRHQQPLSNPSFRNSPKLSFKLKSNSFCFSSTNKRTSFFASSFRKFQPQLHHLRVVNGLQEDSTKGASKDDEENSLGVKAALSMLNFYKREISPVLPRSCRFVPTCSEYSMIAYKKYGVAKGTILTAWRLCRCNPLGGSGFDPPRWFDEPSPPEQ